MIRYQLLVFDWDGTLMDSEKKIVSTVHAVTDDLGLPRIEEYRIRNVIGLGLPEAVQILFPGSEGSFLEQVIGAYRRNFIAASALPAELFPGAAQTLRALREAGYLLAVATGKSRRGLESDLSKTGVRDQFHATRCADETSSKPDALMLRELMEELAVECARTLVIGDTEYDLTMARNGGADSVAVSTGAHDRQRLLALRPRACLESIAELPAWLETDGSGARQ